MVQQSRSHTTNRPFVLFGILEDGVNVTNPDVTVHVAASYPENGTFAECTKLVHDSNAIIRDDISYEIYANEAIIKYAGTGTPKYILWSDITAKDVDITKCPCNPATIESLRFVGSCFYQIGDNGFEGKTQLKSVIFDEDAELSIYQELHWSYPLTKFVLPNKVKTLGLNVFTNTGFSEITIPKSEKIRKSAFSDCANFVTAHMHEATNIEKDSFKGNSKLLHFYYCGTKEPTSNSSPKTLFSSEMKVKVEVS